jgi:geranylgeranyl diphosphate synthase type I
MPTTSDSRPVPVAPSPGPSPSVGDPGEYLAALDRELRDVTRTRNPQYADFFNMLHYHLGWTDARGDSAAAETGKRIRPLLCLWSCEAVGANWRDALPAAAAIELIHNFSLIHDDIQDNSESRRGRATVWKVWGIAQGINAGDAMFVMAHQAMNEIPTNISLASYVGIQRTFNTAILKLTQGQYLDLAYERAERVTLDRYFDMVHGKTAALVSAACEIGARIGTNDVNIFRTLANYGENLGVAFQIADDVLGLWGDPEVTGKSVRTDLLSRKKSYPVLYAMQTDRGQELRALYAVPEWSPGDIKRIEAILLETGAREHAVRQAEAYARQAQGALQAANLSSPAVTRLRDLIHQVVYRSK